MHKFLQDISQDAPQTSRSFLCTVTPFSKYLAVVLFVALPFVGFWVGTEYGNSERAIDASMDNAVVAEMRHELCATFNTGGRAGGCATNAPPYCSVVYYPPSCPTCQDGAGCGYAVGVVSDVAVREQSDSLSKNQSDAEPPIVDFLESVVPEALPTCFADINLSEVGNIATWKNYDGNGFSVQYPADQVDIVESGEVEGEYTIRLLADESLVAHIRVYLLQDEHYTARYRHSSSIRYELYSDAWWRQGYYSDDISAASRCVPNVAGKTLSGDSIFLYGDGDVGVGYTSYVIVFRDVPDNSSRYEPRVVELTSYSHGDSYDIAWLNRVTQLERIVSDMAQTVKLHSMNK
jgi:hypothetical protein